MIKVNLYYGNDHGGGEVEFEFKDGSVAIDCGANVGQVTHFLSEAGFEKVYSFEPNLHAFNILQKRFADNPKVECMPKAVTNSSKSGPGKLYFHKKANQDQVKYSTGSSTAADKHNVDENNFMVVEMVGIGDFIKSLDRPVGMLKIDVEGTEADILNDLFDSGLVNEIGQIFVETHERKVPSSQNDMKLIRERIEKEGIKNIHLEWE
jgi:FkbM family methyltransferase